MPSMSRDGTGRNAGNSNATRHSRTSADDSTTTSGDDSPSEHKVRKQRPFSRPSSRGPQNRSSAFSAASTRNVPAFPFPLNPTVQMASASAGFNFHPPVAINSLTNSGRYSFDSLTGSYENGNWRPGSGGQLPSSLWFPPAQQFAMNPYFPFGPCYGATPNNYVEAMRQMMPPTGENVVANGIHESSAEKGSRSSSPKNRKRALSISPASDMMNFFSELIRSSSGSLGHSGLHGDLSSRCSSSTSRGSFSHLSAGTISPTALYACRPPFFAQNLPNYGAKLPSGSNTPVMPPMYPYPFMLMPPFSNHKPEQMVNAPVSSMPGAPHHNLFFPGFTPFPQNFPVDLNSSANVLSTNSQSNKTTPDKSECKVTSTVNNSPASSHRSDNKSKPVSSGSRRSVSSTVVDADNEALIKEEVDVIETICRWDMCSKQFATQNELVLHVEQHVKAQKEHICKWKECSRDRKPFKALYMLVVHMRQHTGEKPHKCSYENCTKAYGRLENLKTHLRSHSGEKPYQCEVEGCTKAFSNASDRAKHQNRTHSNEKPYACTLNGCSKRYTDPSSLRKHIKTVHGVEAYNNKRHKRCDSDHDNQNLDNGRGNDGMGSDRSPSNDETGSRNDPLGSVQSGNADSPGTFSNPTDDFCTSVSPQANDSGVEMNLATDSLSCIMDSVYSSAELEAEISEAIVVAIDVQGDGELWLNDRSNRNRQRIALKQTLPTISSGIPYESERRVADYMSTHYPASQPVSLNTAQNNIGVVSGASGQQPHRPNRPSKAPMTISTSDSVSSLASSMYGSLKSVSDATSYPTFTDCSRPNSVMSSVSASGDNRPLLQNAPPNQLQRQPCNFGANNKSGDQNVYRNRSFDYTFSESNAANRRNLYVDTEPPSLSACRYQQSENFEQRQGCCSRIDTTPEKGQNCCNYALRQSPAINNQRSLSACSNLELITPPPAHSGIIPVTNENICCHKQPSAVACCCENRRFYNSGGSHESFQRCDKNCCGFKGQPSVSSVNNAGCAGIHPCNRHACHCYQKIDRNVNNNTLYRNVAKSFPSNNGPFMCKPSASSSPYFDDAYADNYNPSLLNRTNFNNPNHNNYNRSPCGPNPVRCSNQFRSHQANVQDIPMTSLSARSNLPVDEPEFDFSILTLRSSQPPNCPSPIESAVADLSNYERPPTIMERQMSQTQQQVYQPTNLAATDMASNLMCYLKENQLYQFYKEQRFSQ